MSTARFLKADEFGMWNDFIDRHPQGTVFHKPGWLKLINPSVDIYTLWKNETIIAGAALIKTKKNGITGYHIPPYTQYFSPLYYDADNKDSLTAEHECIMMILDKIKDARHIDFKLFRGHQPFLPYYWKGFESSVGITYVIKDSLETYLDSLNKNKARELKKLLGMKSSGEIIIEHDIEEHELIQLLHQTAKRKSFNAKTHVAVNIVMRSDPSFAKKIVIRSGQHGLIAFGFFPYDNRSVYNLINASVRIADPVLKTVNLLLLYEAIEFALTSNRIFDFEGSMLPGVEAFCRLMGGRQMPVYRLQRSPSLPYSLLRAARQIKNDRKKT